MVALEALAMGLDATAYASYNFVKARPNCPVGLSAEYKKCKLDAL